MSDIVGRVDLVPHNFIDINYRFRLNGFSTTPRRNDVRLRVGAPIFSVSAEYFLLEEPQGEFGDRREEVSGTIRTLVGDRVTLNARHRRDLNQVGPLEYGAGFFYQDECFGWQFDWTRKFTRDEEVGESDSFFSRLVFKYLGDFSAPTF